MNKYSEVCKISKNTTQRRVRNNEVVFIAFTNLWVAESVIIFLLCFIFFFNCFKCFCHCKCLGVSANLKFCLLSSITSFFFFFFFNTFWYICTCFTKIKMCFGLFTLTQTNLILAMFEASVNLACCYLQTTFPDMFLLCTYFSLSLALFTLKVKVSLFDMFLMHSSFSVHPMLHPHLPRLHRLIHCFTPSPSKLLGSRHG